MVTDYAKLAEQLEQLAAKPPADLLEDKAARHRLAAAAALLVPKVETREDTIQRINYVPLELTAARIGSNMGLFAKLTQASSPVSTEKIAQSVEGDVTTVDRLLRYMAASALIEEVDVRKWAATEVTKTLAQPAVAGGLVHNFDTLLPALLAMPALLKSKKYEAPTSSAETAFAISHDNTDAFTWLGGHPENMQAMGMWMTIQRYASKLWLSAFPFKDVVLAGVSDPARVVFVDVGGGVGHQSQAVLSEFPELKGRVVLQDQAIALKDALKIEGVTNQPINFLEDQPTKGAKAYYLRNILHDWPDKQSEEILTIIKSAMAPDSLILIDEMCIPSKRAHKIATQVDLTMMCNLAGEERSEIRWRELLSKVGLKIDRIYTYQKELGDSVIVASIA